MARFEVLLFLAATPTWGFAPPHAFRPATTSTAAQQQSRGGSVQLNAGMEFADLIAPAMLTAAALVVTVKPEMLGNVHTSETEVKTESQVEAKKVELEVKVDEAVKEIEAKVQEVEKEVEAKVKEVEKEVEAKVKEVEKELEQKAEEAKQAVKEMEKKAKMEEEAKAKEQAEAKMQKELEEKATKKAEEEAKPVVAVVQEEKEKVVAVKEPVIVPQVPKPRLATTTTPKTISQVKKEVASTLEGEREKQERIKLAAAKRELEEKEAAAETASVVTVGDVNGSSEGQEKRSKSLRRKLFRVLKKGVAPWRKWENIK